MPLVPCTGIFLGPSKSGKTVALISLILEQYRGVFERIYIFSPSINVDDGWIPVKKYIDEDLGVNVEKDQAYWEDWDEAALRRIIQQQRKITETSKKLEMKKLYQVLIILDDLADMPQLHKPNRTVDTLFIRGRHMQISTWVSSQKPARAAVRVNQQFLCCWRLRNQHELDAVIEELSALLPKEQLHRLYKQATREPYSFLFVYYLKCSTSALERFALEKDAGAALSFLALFCSLTPARSVLDFESFAGRGQMLDGRVLGASQVEYKLFGKPPLKREVLFCVRAFARRSLQLSLQFAQFA